jgi:hypothetical protein
MALTVNTVILQIQNSPLAFAAGLLPGVAAAWIYKRKYTRQKNSGVGNIG